jgi:GT2 family glycosyltransferase
LSSSSVAIVILNYNGKKHLETFLPSVINTSYANSKIIIADNVLPMIQYRF